MMRSFAVTTLVLGPVLLLGGCQSTQTQSRSVAPQAVASTNVTPADFKMPTGTGCSGDVARWEAIQNNDLQMGHVTQSVYNQIQTEIAAASTACQAGRGAEASGMVSASKRRHGYPG